MPDRLFFERMLGNMSGIDIHRIKSGNYTVEEGRIIQECMKKIKTQPFVHIYMPQATNQQVFSLVKTLKYKMNLQFLIYDYLKSDEPDSATNYNLLGQQANFLKNDIAGALNIAVLTGAQLNRANTVADSDKIERYVSTSIWWREKEPEEIQRDGIACGNYCATIDINRLGAQMSQDDYLDFKLYGACTRIEEAEPHDSTDCPI